MRSELARARTFNAQTGRSQEGASDRSQLEFGCLEVGAERSGEYPNEATDKVGDMVVRSKLERSAR